MGRHPCNHCHEAASINMDLNMDLNIVLDINISLRHCNHHCFGGPFLFRNVFSRQVLFFWFLVLCFSAFLLFAFPAFRFSAFCFSCFAALPAPFVFCLLSLLLCLGASVPFYFYYSTWSFLQQCVFADLLPAPLPLCFMSLLPFCFGFTFLLLDSLLFLSDFG